MASARNLRRLSTSTEHGLGLLEIILPQSSRLDPIPTLPGGQRDTGGFWFPSGYTQPSDIFTPAQRKLQAKQRLVQRVRHGKRAAAPIDSGQAESSLPLPAPSREVTEPAVPPQRGRSGQPATPAELAARPPFRHPEVARAVAARPVVDSHKGSD
jgi:hypothetical protein